MKITKETINVFMGIIAFFLCLSIMDKCGDAEDAIEFRSGNTVTKNGVIVSCPSKSGNCVYTFSFHNKIYKGSRHCSECNVGDSVQVIISKSNPNFNKIDYSF